jgi:hypothetical protein
VKPEENFKAVTYTGTSGTAQSITGVGFKPDFTWFKSRLNARSHALYDSVRGHTHALLSESTAAEDTVPESHDLVSWDDDGFSLGSTVGYNSVNGPGDSIVAWNFKAGGDAVANNDGNIPSMVSANQEMGFSVVSWTGTGANGTVGHGLSTPPSLIISKARYASYNWVVQSPAWESTSTPNILYLNTSAPAAQDANIFQIYPNSVNFYPQGGSWLGIGQLNHEYITYCFANSDMLQVGTYTGNGLTDGPFVSLPFKPAYTLIKNTQGGNNWYLHDNARNPSNPIDKELFADISNIEATYPSINYLSNGFQVISEGTGINGSGSKYLYMTIAEETFKHARGG